MKRVPISQVFLTRPTPSIIKDDKFKKLVKSIEEFPEMLELRPIVVDANMVVLGGNMRLKACLAAGLKEVPIIIADKLTDAQKAEFVSLRTT
jgi:ParB-like chromosome segregation protein Spo0J